MTGVTFHSNSNRKPQTGEDPANGYMMAITALGRENTFLKHQFAIAPMNISTPEI